MASDLVGAVFSACGQNDPEQDEASRHGSRVICRVRVPLCDQVWPFLVSRYRSHNKKFIMARSAPRHGTPRALELACPVLIR